MKWIPRAAAALSLAILAGCSGSSREDNAIKSIRVFGDSLADTGTFGFKFTVGGPNTTVYSDLTAQKLGLNVPCNFFAFTGTTFNTRAPEGCTNYAVGGGVINGTGAGITAADPRNISVQLGAATAVTGNFTGKELLLIDGGGNDAANLVGAYLNIAVDKGAAYTKLLGTVLPAATVQAAAAGGAAGLAGAGNAYMAGLADTLIGQINALAINKGATRVAVLNAPLITLTPRFQAVLTGVAAASGGGAAGATARAQVEGLVKSWVESFNARLAANVKDNPNFAIVDFYGLLNGFVAEPAKYGFTNVKDTACPVTGLGSDGLPTYTFQTCTEANLAAKPPTGVTGAEWYRTYLFSDGFHPTPLAHSLATNAITDVLKAKGWM